MTRPLASLDLETTGTDLATDRIVQVGIHYLNGDRPSLDILVNPGRPIPAQATECHGITDAMVADAPSFADVAQQIHDALVGHDLVGFNHRNFDIPLLWEEFYRAGVAWDLTDVNVIDVGALFKKFEPRTLSAAVKFYCGKDHENAHRALDDATATSHVLAQMLLRYEQLAGLDNAQLAQASAFDARVDLAGKIVLNDQGVPCYGFGKHANRPVTSDRSYAEWMLGSNFPEQTKQVLRRILGRP